MFVITVQDTFTSPNLPKLYRDPLLDGANGGVLFDADLAFTYCAPASAPANGAVVKDITDDGTNGVVVLTSGSTISHSGGGYDFSGVIIRGNYLELPADVSAAIWADPNQYFLLCMYVKLPSLADWNTSAAGMRPFMQFASNAGNEATEAGLLSIMQYRNPVATGAAGIEFIRQTTALGTSVKTDLILNPADHGLFAQVAFWRNAAGIGARIKTVNGNTLVTGPVGVANTNDFSAQTAKFGVVGTRYFAPYGNEKNWRLYRPFIESLTTSGRDPVAVLNADYARVVARGVFS